MTKRPAETPATGIMKTNEFPDSTFYKISCECGSDEHIVDMEIEYSDYQILVNLYTVATTDFWTEFWHGSEWKSRSPFIYQLYRVFGGFVNSMATKVSLTYDIWFKGYAKYSSSHILNEQQAINVANTILNGIDHLKRSN